MVVLELEYSTGPDLVLLVVKGEVEFLAWGLKDCISFDHQLLVQGSLEFARPWQVIPGKGYVIL